MSDGHGVEEGPLDCEGVDHGEVVPRVEVRGVGDVHGVEEGHHDYESVDHGQVVHRVGVRGVQALAGGAGEGEEARGDHGEEDREEEAPRAGLSAASAGEQAARREGGVLRAETSPEAHLGGAGEGEEARGDRGQEDREVEVTAPRRCACGGHGGDHGGEGHDARGDRGDHDVIAARDGKNEVGGAHDAGWVSASRSVAMEEGVIHGHAYGQGGKVGRFSCCCS